MKTPDAMALEVDRLVERIRPILAGHPPDVQSGVLADLLAIWLAGHVGSHAEKVRKKLLADHLKLVRKLVPPNEKIMLARLRAAGSS